MQFCTTKCLQLFEFALATCRTSSFWMPQQKLWIILIIRIPKYATFRFLSLFFKYFSFPNWRIRHDSCIHTTSKLVARLQTRTSGRSVKIWKKGGGQLVILLIGIPSNSLPSPPTVLWMGFYADISWESRCCSEIKVWGHFCQIFVDFEVPAQPLKGMSGNS